jgi:hypothetical protein
MKNKNISVAIGVLIEMIFAGFVVCGGLLISVLF